MSKSDEQNAGLSRRDLPAVSYTRIFLICMSLCGAANPTWSEEALNESTKPNILVLIADDASMDFGCYGNKGIKTPNIDALAASGLRIDKAFLTGSQCSPSSTAMITGQFAHTIGTEKLSSKIVTVRPLNGLPLFV